jgi:hypothetical protein
MSPATRKLVIGGAFAAVLAAGVGVAAAGPSAVPGAGDDDEPALSGETLDRASAVALDVAAQYGKGGTITGTEGPDEETSYEVEVTLADGTVVDVDLDQSFTVLGTPEVEGQDDAAGEPNDDGGVDD